MQIMQEVSTNTNIMTILGTFLLCSLIIIIGIIAIVKRYKYVTKTEKALWQNIVNENYNSGFKKGIVLFNFIPQNIQNRVFSDKMLKYWLNGIWVNYQDKLIKIKGDYGNNNYIQIPFQDLYDVRIDSLGISKTKGWGYGDTITLFGTTTTERLKSVNVQIITKDATYGGLKIYEIQLVKSLFAVKRGTPSAIAYEKCSAAILSEISYIIDNFS